GGGLGADHHRRACLDLFHPHVIVHPRTSLRTDSLCEIAAAYEDAPPHRNHSRFCGALGSGSALNTTTSPAASCVTEGGRAYWDIDGKCPSAFPGTVHFLPSQCSIKGTSSFVPAA